MQRILIGLGYAAAGVAVAVGLTAAAYAIGGREVSRPVLPIRIGEAHERVAPPAATSPRPAPEPSIRDADEPRTDNSGRGSANSGSGSGDDDRGRSRDDRSNDDEPDDD